MLSGKISSKSLMFSENVGSSSGIDIKVCVALRGASGSKFGVFGEGV